MTLNQSNISDRQSTSLEKQTEINTKKRPFESLHIAQNPSTHTIKEPPKQKRKLADVISTVYQRNRDFIEENHSLKIQNKVLQEQSQWLLIQKDWYKQRLLEIQSVLNSIIAETDEIDKICYTPPFTEITTINNASNTQNTTDSTHDIIRIPSQDNSNVTDANESNNEHNVSSKPISMISLPSSRQMDRGRKEEENVDQDNDNHQKHELTTTVSSNTNRFQSISCIKHIEKSGYCVDCNLYFEGDRGLVAHRRGSSHILKANSTKKIHNAEECNTMGDTSYKCWVCASTYENYTRFTQHLRVTHKLSTDKYYNFK